MASDGGSESPAASKQNPRGGVYGAYCSIELIRLSSSSVWSTHTSSSGTSGTKLLCALLAD